MNIVVGVTIGGVSPSTGRVLAFVGTQMRGTSQPGLRIPFGPAAGVYSFEMTVYGDVEGEVLNFFHQGADGQLTALDRTIPYKAREVVGNALCISILIDWRRRCVSAASSSVASPLIEWRCIIKLLPVSCCCVRRLPLRRMGPCLWLPRDGCVINGGCVTATSLL